MFLTIGFVFFVMTLHRGYYKKQFREFCWTHMTILLVIGQAHFVINNILEGMFWFVVPAMFVICNDISAYICGKLFGRTPLIELSPKKTVEGFVGAWALTVMLGSIVAELVMQSHYFICPAKVSIANIVGILRIPALAFNFAFSLYLCVLPNRISD